MGHRGYAERLQNVGTPAVPLDREDEVELLHDEKGGVLFTEKDKL